MVFLVQIPPHYGTRLCFVGPDCLSRCLVVDSYLLSSSSRSVLDMVQIPSVRLGQGPALHHSTGPSSSSKYRSFLVVMTQVHPKQIDAISSSMS
ncbi:hypothetical protein RRG08_009655 [Elysia crispata]|uniref:Uncharacterized protein n=1 Tax=Elysia crispata TaxID=231223 RepID=A0AAE0ZWJ9_9GAST|nr:hypothetical protein RRG08_009655 [Elysia crispata]